MTPTPGVTSLPRQAAAAVVDSLLFSACARSVSPGAPRVNGCSSLRSKHFDEDTRNIPTAQLCLLAASPVLLSAVRLLLLLVATPSVCPLLVVTLSVCCLLLVVCLLVLSLLPVVCLLVPVAGAMLLLPVFAALLVLLLACSHWLGASSCHNACPAH